MSPMLIIPRAPPITNNTCVIAYRLCNHLHFNILSIFFFRRANQVSALFGSASVIKPTPKTMNMKLSNSQTLAHISLSLHVFCEHYTTGKNCPQHRVSPLPIGGELYFSWYGGLIPAHSDGLFSGQFIFQQGMNRQLNKTDKCDLGQPSGEK